MRRITSETADALESIASARNGRDEVSHAAGVAAVRFASGERSQCRVSYGPVAGGRRRAAPQTALSVAEQKSRAALLLVVRGERLTSELGDARLRAREEERVAWRVRKRTAGPLELQ
jgi:hypothetical protein